MNRAERKARREAGMSPMSGIEPLKGGDIKAASDRLCNIAAEKGVQEAATEVNVTRCAYCGKKLPIVGTRVYASYCGEFDGKSTCAAKHTRDKEQRPKKPKRKLGRFPHWTSGSMLFEEVEGQGVWTVYIDVPLSRPATKSDTTVQYKRFAKSGPSVHQCLEDLWDQYMAATSAAPAHTAKSAPQTEPLS